MSRERYTVVCLASGQPRPYADSCYHYRVTVEWQGPELIGASPDRPFVPRPELDRSIVLPILRGLTRGWEDNPGAFGRRLERCDMTSPGVWDVVIVEPFTD